MNNNKGHDPESGVWTTPCRASCAHCGQVTAFEFPLYVHEDFWPNFREMVISEDLKSPACSKCKRSLDFPLIFDSSRLGLLIFIARRGDHQNVKRDFEHHFEIVARNLPGELVEEAKKKPYSFVNGWYGFRALLECFNDIDPKPRRDPASTYEDQSFGVSTAIGYIYGKLFFYYPDQAAIEEIAYGFMQIAQNHRIHGRLDFAYNVLKKGVNATGVTHQWLVQELGTTALETGDLEGARHWLDMAVRLQHKWLAPTTSFMDATPTQREDGETQDRSIPHATPASSRGKITESRHAVIRQFPPTSDYGLWHFPILQDHVIPPEHLQFERRLITYGVVLGEFLYSLELYEGTTLNILAAHHRVLEEYLEYMKQLRQSNVTIPTKLHEAFWTEYALSRWRIPRNFQEIANSPDFRVMHELAEKLGNVMGVIGKEIRKLRQHDTANIEIFFLENSIQLLFHLAENFIKDCPANRRKELMTVRLQSEVDTLSDTPGQWTVSMSQ